VPAVTRFNFDPSTSFLGISIRLETLALAGVILLVLLVAALSAGRERVALDDSGPVIQAAPKMRRDDLILIAFGAVPGAVVGGRLSYVLVHLDYYSADPRAVVDPGQGGFGLTLAVVLGTITAIAVARLLAAPINRWLGVAAIPLLLGLGLGKLTMVLGGVGQGRYSGSTLATAYAGPGPWGSINPTFSALPSQAVEGCLVLAVAVLVLILPSVLRLRIRDWRLFVRPGWASRHEWSLLTGGRRYLTVLVLWAAVRFVAAFTWRDAHVVGPFVADQLVLVLVMAVCLVGSDVVAGLRRLRRAVAARLAARLAARRTTHAARPAQTGAEPDA
jgi:prolipoprotein diacylglyceryltransferase